MGIYLDYNATTPIDPRVLEVMIDVYQNSYGNADSRTHDYGDKARKIIEEARKEVASMLKVSSNEVFFTSGATESINTAIQGLKDYAEKTGKKHIITSSIEHKAVLETCKMMQNWNFDVDFVNPDISGIVPSEAILSKIRKDTLLVALMHVNNETGIIQPVKEIGDYLKKQDVLFLVDATQSCGKLVEEIQNLNYDMLAFSGHKLRGPQGCGVLVLKRKGYKLPPVKPILFGGQQEHGISPGTSPVALIAGTGAACKIAYAEYKENARNNKNIKEMIMTLLKESGIRYHVNGDQSACVDTTINVCLEGIMSEALMISTKSFCGISNGSACTSKSYEPSYVLTAMGVPAYEAECSIRISWGAGTNIDDVTSNIKKLLEIAKMFS